MVAGALIASVIGGRPVMCASLRPIPETLLESELFGHEKGASPARSSKKAGRVEEADGGKHFPG